MIIPLTMIPYVNIFIVVFVAIMLFLGYQRGFLYQVFSLLGVLSAILISWFFAPVVASQVHIYPEEWCPFAYTDFADIFYDKMNTLIWYIILFAIVSIIFALLKPLAKAVQKIPLIGSVNKVLGMIFGLIPSLVVILFLTYFMSTPVVKNGKDVIDQTWLGPIRNASTNVVYILQKPYEVNEALQKLIADPISLTEEETKLVLEWLISEHDNTDEVYEFVNEHSIHQMKKQ